MKLKLKKKSFLDIAGKIVKTLPNKTIIPIHDFLLLQSTDEGIEITGGSEAVRVTGLVECHVDEILNICIPGRLLVQTIQGISEDEFNFEVKGNLVHITSKTGKYKINYFDGKEYTSFSPAKVGSEAKISASHFCNIVSGAVEFSGDNEMQSHFYGISIFEHEGKMLCSGTDGLSMGMFDIKGDFENWNKIMIHPFNCQHIVSIFEDAGELHIYHDGSKMTIASETFSMRLVLSEANFPEKALLNLFNAPRPHHTIFKKEEMEGAIKRVSNFSSVVSIEFMGEITQLCCIGPDGIGGEEDINSTPSEKMKIYITKKFFFPILRLIQETEVRLSYADPKSNILIEGVGNEKQKFLIGPSSI
jgi:DNA polymerase III sliding clamp (beta) subunit (PCNA family)